MQFWKLIFSEPAISGDTSKKKKVYANKQRLPIGAIRHDAFEYCCRIGTTRKTNSSEIWRTPMI